MNSNNPFLETVIAQLTEVERSIERLSVRPIMHNDSSTRDEMINTLHRLRGVMLELYRVTYPTVFKSTPMLEWPTWDEVKEETNEV